MINVSTYFKSSEIWELDRIDLENDLEKEKTMTF